MATGHGRLVLDALRYFGIVFATGFALALVRIPFLVPALGMRAAELLEMPVMWAVIAWASRRLVRSPRRPSALYCLAAGLLALALLLAAELAVGVAQGARSLADLLAGRDPVSGSVYLVSLLAFGLAPWLWRRAGPRD
mgnify:CR=1 FL=1